MMHTAEAAAPTAAPAAAPTAAPAAPGTFWQFLSKCSDPSSSDPSSLFRSRKHPQTLTSHLIEESNWSPVMGPPVFQTSSNTVVHSISCAVQVQSIVQYED